MNTLTFHTTNFDVVDRNNQLWLRSPQIAVSLGYNRSDRVNELFARNADEFTDSMTALVELDTNGGKQQVRIFSLRGCHLLAMFARTAIAKEFRKWVLDILDQQACLPPPSDTITIDLRMVEATKQISLKLDTSECRSYGRYFVTHDADNVIIRKMGNEMCMTEEQWVKYMTQERGYLVVKKRDVLPKLES